MFALLDPQMARIGSLVLAIGQLLGVSLEPPERIALYYSGARCSATHVDRTYSSFQVNLDEQHRLLTGRLASQEGEAVLLSREAGPVRLVSNASRADWLLAYPLTGSEVGVWGRSIHGEDCARREGIIYMESLYPSLLFEDRIDPRVDLATRIDAAELAEALAGYGWALSPKSRAEFPPHMSPRRRNAMDRLEKTLFSDEWSRMETPWRIRIYGPEGARDAASSARTVSLLLSGSDGSTGMFGHISVAIGHEVFNVYPRGSERGSPGIVPLWDYLFNAQRGQALRRPTWMLRLDGLPEELVASLEARMLAEVGDIEEGRSVYHPVKNNCTTLCVNALAALGLDPPSARYFTKRFPRPAFTRLLEQIKERVSSGRLEIGRAEMAFIPQVPEGPRLGTAPNRPFWDGARLQRD